MNKQIKTLIAYENLLANIELECSSNQLLFTAARLQRIIIRQDTQKLIDTQNKYILDQYKKDFLYIPSC